MLHVSSSRTAPTCQRRTRTSGLRYIWHPLAMLCGSSLITTPTCPPKTTTGKLRCIGSWTMDLWMLRGRVSQGQVLVNSAALGSGLWSCEFCTVSNDARSTPPHWASRSGHHDRELAQFLVEHGADVSAKTKYGRLRCIGTRRSSHRF
jgi:hypothetical protein